MKAKVKRSVQKRLILWKRKEINAERIYKEDLGLRSQRAAPGVPGARLGPAPGRVSARSAHSRPNLLPPPREAQRKAQSIPRSPRRWGCVHLRRLQLAAASQASPLPPSRPPFSPPRPPLQPRQRRHGPAQQPLSFGASRGRGSLERP